MSLTLYKAVYASFLQVDYTERPNVCCLCLERIEDSGISIYDEVTFQIPKHPRPEATTVAHIINFIMDQRVSDIMFMLKSVCEECMAAAINCFKFIQVCKDNTKIISAILDNLEMSCDKILQDINQNFNSVYVAVETNENEPEKCLVKHYYDKNRQFVPQDTAFMRFKQMTENIIENYTDMTMEDIDNTVQIDDLDESLQEIMCCKKNISTEELLHDPHKPSEIKCRVCLKSFTYNTSLRVHFFKVHRNNKVKCKKCSPPKDNSNLINHPMFNIQTLEECDVSSGDNDNWQDEEDNLKISSKAMINKNTVVDILKAATDPIITAQDGLKLSSTYSCKKCKQNFKTYYSYMKHVATKKYKCKRPPRGHGEFICDHCGYTAFYKQQLVRHITLKHLGKQRYVCEICGQNFFTQSELTPHRIIKHTKENQFTCEVCGIKCDTKLMLNSHRRIHTGEKPYPCPKCSKCFRRTCDLSAHFQRMHNFVYHVKCKFCEKLFKSEKDKAIHEARHLRSNSLVNRRLKKLKGEIPTSYPCPNCSRCFKRKYDLQQHIKRIHNPVYSYECNYCPSKFTTKQNKSKHEIRHIQDGIVNKKLLKKSENNDCNFMVVNALPTPPGI